MEIRYNQDLGSRNTFRMKVKCACFVEYDSLEELEAIDFSTLQSPVLHIGSGSNLLFTKDFPGTVLHSRIHDIEYLDEDNDTVRIKAGAGIRFDDFVAETCRRGLWGAENLSLIPGETGAAAVQNIGAYGVEAKDIIDSVRCYDLKERHEAIFRNEECGYGYRDSMFKHLENKGRYIVTEADFVLTRKFSPHLDYKGLAGELGKENGTLTPQKVREAVIRIRKAKLPDPAETGSAGSFFKNPVISQEIFSAISPDGTAPHFTLPDGTIKVPAAWMIEQCGFKGAEYGGAAVYEKQPLVLTNRSGKASPEDVLGLEKMIINGVEKRFGVVLHPEVEHI